jgi:hypothetical protein
MPVNVMHVRGVRVSMFYPTVLMPMGMWFAHWIIRSMLMLMMFVMHMRMRMRRRLVDVFMLVPLRHVQPNT